MFALVRLTVILLIVLTIVYVLLSLYSRSVRRDKLEEWFEEERAEDPTISPAEKDEYVRQGLAEYDDSLRRKLILGVYVVPILLVAGIIYFTNFAGQ